MADKTFHGWYPQPSATLASGLLLGSLATVSLLGQTAVDLRNQSKQIDFSNASATRVWKTGSALPSHCAAGEGFFLTGANAGQNLYLCSSTDTWTLPAAQLSGSGTHAQSVVGVLPLAAVPSIDGTGTEVSSGCTATSGAMTCPAGFGSGLGASRVTATEGDAPAAPLVTQQTLYFDSADHEMKSIDSNGAVRQYASANGAEILSNKTILSPSLASTALSMTVANEQSTGTSANRLAKLTGAPSAAILTSATDTTGALGVVVSGAGSTGTAEIATAGQAQCAFDGPAIAGDYVIISNSVAGDCHDAGLAYPVGLQIIGRVLVSNSAAGSNSVALFPAEVRGSQAVAAGTSFDPLDDTVAWWRDEMTYNYQWYVVANGGGALFTGNPDGSHPGVFALVTGNVPGSVTAILLAWSNSSNVMHYPTADWDMRWVVKPSYLSGAEYSFGFAYSTTDTVTLLYRPSVGPNWLGNVRVAGVDTLVDLGVPASTNTYARLRMRSSGSRFYFSVNGAPERTICASGCDVTAVTHLTGDASVSLSAQVTSTAAGQQGLSVDFFALQISGLSR
jgi:hypothetical protein